MLSVRNPRVAVLLESGTLITTTFFSSGPDLGAGLSIAKFFPSFLRALSTVFPKIVESGLEK